MADPSKRLIAYAARKLLATYVQSGKLNYDVDGCLRDMQLAIGGYEVKDMDSLVRLGFLLASDTRVFVTRVREKLQTLRASTFRRFAVTDGAVRGAINWAQTVPLQIVRPSSFVCTDPYRSFDLPENRMLAFLVESHADDIGKLLQRWGVGSQGIASRDWRCHLAEMQLAIDGIRTNPHYRKITYGMHTSPRQVSQRLVARAHGRRSSLATTILAQYHRYQETCGEKPDKRAVERALLSGLRWPDTDKLFELFALFSLTELLRSGATASPTLRPISSRPKGERWFAHMINGAGIELYVYYQKLPRDLAIKYSHGQGDSSIRDYVRVLGRHGDNLGMLRPDIVVDCHSPHGRRLLIVEAKNSENHETFRYGVRELVDYCHLVRTKNIGPVNAELHGLLFVRDFPPRLRATSQEGDGYSITTGGRILDCLEHNETHAELTAIASFCWSA